MLRARLRSCRAIAFACSAVLVGGLSWLNFTKGDPATVPGDAIDGRLLLGLAEHWYQVFQGRTSWRTLQMFHPAEGSLGLSDGLFLYGCLHSALRACGLDLWASWQITLPLLAVTGFAGMYLFLRRAFRMPADLARWGSLYVVFSSQATIAAHNSHVQLLTVWQFPLFLLALFMCWRTKDRPVRTWLPWLVATAAFGGALALTGFYMFWFNAFFLPLTALAYLATGRGGTAAGLWPLPPLSPHAVLPGRGLRSALWRSRGHIAASILVAVLAMLPFLLTYLPVMESQGGHNMYGVRGYLARPTDLINCGDSNLVWGDWIRRSYLDRTAVAAGERQYGWPFLTAALLGLSLVWAVFRQKCPWLRATAIAIGLTTVLLIHLGAWSPWRILHAAVPGASAIRAPFRFQLYLTLPVAVLCLSMLRTWRGESRFRHAACSLLLLLVLVEQIHPRYTHPRLSATADGETMERIPPPPPGLRSFFVEPVPAGVDGRESSLLAWWVAQRESVPTSNGYSGLCPSGYVSPPPDQPGYEKAMLSWLYDRAVFSGVGRLDMGASRWHGPQPLAAHFRPLAFGRDYVTLPVADDQIFWAGWSFDEDGVVWSTGQPAVLLVPDNSGTPELVLDLEVIAENPGLRPVPRAELLVNGRIAWSGERTPSRSRQPARIVLHAGDYPNGFAEIHLSDPAAVRSDGTHLAPRLGLTRLVLQPGPK